MKKILVSAIAFGYGPVTTCLNVIKFLKNYSDITLDFIGSGIALEQAKMSHYFNNYYKCDSYDDLANFEELFKTYDGVFSVEDDKVAIFSKKIGVKKVYYLDNLMWMWNELDDTLKTVNKFFISEVMPSKKNVEIIGAGIENPIFVGPIRNMNFDHTNKLLNKVIINIGGADSFMLDNNLILAFYNKLINLILNTPNFIDSFDDIVICGGSTVISKLNVESKNNKIRKATLYNLDYLDELKTTSYCIMAPGLGNFAETINANKHILYLPAINYSQFLQTKFYSKLDLGFYIIGWEKFDNFYDVPEMLDEETGVNLVLNNVRSFVKNNVTDIVESCVKEFIKTSQKAYFQKRHDFVNKYYKDSSQDVANEIYSDLKGAD